MTVFFEDIRYALRSFYKRPGFTAAILLTLGLGIGSNVAIFSVANAVLFRPLPYSSPEELVLVWNRLLATDVPRALVSGPDFLDYRSETTSFEGFAGAFAVAGTLTGEGPAEQVMSAWITPNLFQILGVAPMIGRDFEVEDEAPVDFELFMDPTADVPPGVVILSYGLWQRRFGSDPDVLGRTVQMDGQGSVIVGVLPPDFRIYLPTDAGMPTDIDTWRVIPSNLASDFPRDVGWLTVVARLQTGVTPERAQHEMDALALRLREQYQEHANTNMNIMVNSMHRDVVNHARPVLLALLSAAGFVLLIACSNVANLLLVRATSRGREIAVRAALGGGRGRIIRQMLTESGVLATAGALLGLLLAGWGIRVLVAMRPGSLPRLDSVAIDGTVLLFTAGATVLAALVFGAAPALRAASTDLADALKERGSETGGIRGNKLRTALVISEVGLSMVLLIGAGLMLRSFAKLQQVEPGFESENVVTFSVPLPMFKYPQPNARADFVNRLKGRLENLPAVEEVGGVTPLPLAGGDQYSVGSYGREDATAEEYSSNTADYRGVMPGYMAAMKIRLLAGRTLLVSDNEPGALQVAVVDEKLANRLWPDEDPIGQQLMLDHFSVESFGVEQTPVRVVGVVGNVRAENLAADGRETVYVPYLFQPWFPLTVTVRGTVNPTEILPLLRREVNAMDPDVPVANVRFMDEYVDEAMAQTRFTLTLIAVFAALALILASLGLYGVISYSVRQRTREIGVRITFGASERDVVKLVLKQGMAVALLGVSVGLLAAFVLTRWVASLLVGVTATDPLTFLGIPAILLVVSLVASYLPARRAMSVDPVQALRDE